MANEKKIDLDKYITNLNVINDIVSEKKLEEIPITITFTEAQNFEELNKFQEKHEVTIDSLEVRLSKNGEKFTAFVESTDDISDSFYKITEISVENDLELVGILSANITSSSNKVKAFEDDLNVSTVDTSASDYIEDKAKTEDEQKVKYAKSLAWELEESKLK